MLGGKHVEIVSKINSYIIADEGFCSIGAGRSTKGEQGIEKCDGAWAWSDARELEKTENSFHFL